MLPNRMAKKSSLRQLSPNVWALTLGSFLTDASSEMLHTLVPLFLTNVLKQSTAVVGLIDGIAETTASLVKIVSGQLSDRLGSRKWLTVAGYALSTVAKPFLYFADAWGWVLGVRFADRMGKGIRTAPRDALLAGSATPESRGLAFGLHRAGDTAGAFTGLLMAALILWFSQSAGATLTRQAFQTIALVSVIPAALAVAALAFGLRETPRGKAAAPATLRLGWRDLDGRFRSFALIVVVFTLGNSSDSFIILRAQQLGLNLMQIFGMLLTFNAVYALLSGPIGALSDRIGRRRVILTGWAVYGLIYLGFALAQSGAMVWVLFGVYGLYYAFTEGTAKALVADLVPAEQRGTAYGYFNAAVGLAALPASLLAGVLWQGVGDWAGFGPAAPFLFGGVMALAAGGLFLMRFRSPQA